MAAAITNMEKSEFANFPYPLHVKWYIHVHIPVPFAVLFELSIHSHFDLHSPLEKCNTLWCPIEHTYCC